MLTVPSLILVSLSIPVGNKCVTDIVDSLKFYYIQFNVARHCSNSAGGIVRCGLLVEDDRTYSQIMMLRFGLHLCTRTTALSTLGINSPLTLF
jgi:hypothetical protein